MFRYRTLCLALCSLLLSLDAALAQVTPYGPRRPGLGNRPQTFSIRGEVVAVSPRGFQVKPEQVPGGAPLGVLAPRVPGTGGGGGGQPGDQQQPAQPVDQTIFVPLVPTARITLAAQVADPALVLKRGALVELSGELEGPRGPIATGGLTILVGRPAVRRGQHNPLAPNARITPGQLPTDPASIWLRGRVVSVSPVVVVAAGRYRFPLRLPESPRITLRIYGRGAVAFVKPETTEITVSLEQVPRRLPMITAISLYRRDPLTAEEIQGGALKKAARGKARSRRSRARPPAKKADAKEAVAEEKDEPKENDQR